MYLSHGESDVIAIGLGTGDTTGGKYERPGDAHGAGRKVIVVMLVVVLLIGKNEGVVGATILDKYSGIVVLQFDGFSSDARFGKGEMDFVPTLHGWGDYNGAAVGWTINQQLPAARPRKFR